MTRSCYAALIHPRPISSPSKSFERLHEQPKSNGYQSLHTVVLPEGRQVEIFEHVKWTIAELGIAAH